MRSALKAVVAALLVLASTASGAAAAPARIAFSSGGDLFTIAADGSARTQLTHFGPRRSSGQPSWSPDGARIAFLSERGENGSPRVWTMRSDGGDARPLTSARKATLELDSEWSPDGTRIAFARATFGRESLRTSIVVANADGSGEQTLVTERLRRLGFLHTPAWSPDGARLVFTRTVLDDDAYFRQSLQEVAADGSGRRLLARDGGDASFSPDASRIAFTSIRDRNGHHCGSDECSYNGEIYTMAADGTDQRRLTTSRADDAEPAWSPDGGRIAFSSERNYPRGDGRELYSIAPDGSCLTWLTNGAHTSESPAWEPGAGLSSDPGACGAVARDPLLDLDVRAATGKRAYWLGPAFGQNLLLSDLYTRRRYVSLNYYDCSSFRPSECPKPVLVVSSPTCSEPPRLLSVNPRRLRGVRGALVVTGASPIVYTGTTKVSMYGLGRAGSAALAALRPVGTDVPPDRLPAPVFGDHVWLKLDPVTRSYRRLRSVAAVALRLHLRPHVVRNRLAVARALRDVHAKRARCPS
jgi:dipeptidyl aminopeptidase/acylaminoacyl peptidase